MISKVISNESEQENKNKEIIINLLLDKYFSSDSNEVYFSKEDCKILNISEPDVSRIIHSLQEEKLLHIKQKSVHNDFSRYWTLEIFPLCVNYFQIKKNNTIEKHRKSASELRAWATLIIAVLAFLLSILSLYLQFFHKKTLLESPESEFVQTDMTETHQSSAYSFDSTPN